MIQTVQRDCYYCIFKPVLIGTSNGYQIKAYFNKIPLEGVAWEDIRPFHIRCCTTKPCDGMRDRFFPADFNNLRFTRLKQLRCLKLIAGRPGILHPSFLLTCQIDARFVFSGNLLFLRCLALAIRSTWKLVIYVHGRLSSVRTLLISSLKEKGLNWSKCCTQYQKLPCWRNTTGFFPEGEKVTWRAILRRDQVKN